MANPPIPLPPGPIIINLDPVNDPVGIPTNEEIVDENRHFLRVQQLDGVNNLTNDEYGNAILRHCRILSSRSDHDRFNQNFGNQNIGVQLTAIAGQLAGMNQRLDGIDGRLDGIDGRLDGIDGRLEGIDGTLEGIDGRLHLMEITRLVDRARMINNRNHTQLNSRFIPIVKHAIGHPNFNPNIPIIANINFQAQYNIGDEPPANLVPRTEERFNELATGPLGNLRGILRGIYWFYNDPTLQLAANSSRANCIIVLQRVKTFILEP